MRTIEDTVEPKCSVLLIDDDDLSREVLSLLLAAGGYRVQAAAGGDDALTQLAPGRLPNVVLADLQMPGLAGNRLANRLRALCGPAVRLLVMSAGDPLPSEIAAYDGFLRKPLSAKTLTDALARIPHIPAQVLPSEVAILDEAVHAHLFASMAPARLTELYAFCLADALQRIERLREAAHAQDDTAFRRQAHTLQGGCGMVGAVELRSLAATLEAEGLANRSTLELQRLLDGLSQACVRLRSMLNTREHSLS